MCYHDDPSAYEARLLDKLEPAQVRSTLAFAGLYQMTHEQIQYAVTTKVRDFFQTDFADGQWNYDEARYATDVLSRHRVRFKASLAWLVDMNALTSAQADRLDAIYAHRNRLTHELMSFIIDPDTEPDLELFVDAMEILTSVMRFWTSVEAAYGTFDDYPDLDLDEVVPMPLMALKYCLSAYADGLTQDDASS